MGCSHCWHCCLSALGGGCRSLLHKPRNASPPLLPPLLRWVLRHQQPLIPGSGFLPGHRCPPSWHMVMAAVTSTAPGPPCTFLQRGRIVPGTQEGHEATQTPRNTPAGPQSSAPQHQDRQTQAAQSCTMLPREQLPSPKPADPLPPSFSPEKEGDPPCRGAGLPLPPLTPCAAAGSGEGAWPVSQRSAGAARALRLLLARLLRVH